MNRIICVVGIAVSLFWRAVAGLGLEPVATIGSPVAEEPEAWAGQVNYLEWLDCETLIYAGRRGFVGRYGLSAREKEWKISVDYRIRQMAVGGGSFFLLDDQGTIHVFDAVKGEPKGTVEREMLAETVGRRFIFPTHLIWLSERKLLGVAAFSSGYGEIFFLLDSGDFSLIARMKAEGALRQLRPASDGTYVVALSSSANRIRVLAVDRAETVFKIGEGHSDGERVYSIDGPFMSNALFDGKNTLIYSIDNSWNTGSVHVHDLETKREVAEFDSRNGHLVMDADFRRSRVALAGTTKSLVLTDMAGGVLVERDEAAVGRISVVRFSPDGRHIALGSWDNTVRVFQIENGGCR